MDVITNATGWKKEQPKFSFQLWQQDNHPIELFNPKILHLKLDYIHYNPVMAGIVDKVEDYLYSSTAPASVPACGNEMISKLKRWSGVVI